MEKEVNIIIDLSKRFFSIAAIFVGGVVLFCIGFLFYQYNISPQNNPHEITVSGEGKAFAKPDIAMVSFGATTQSQKSQDAVNKNNEIMNNVIGAIKNLGVDEKDIQTTSYNLSPLYDYTERGSVFKGYQLNQQISVKIRDFDKISDILDKATSRGATNVGDLQFKIDDPEKIQSKARAMAIAKAKEKLADIMNQSGLKVGKLVNISEGYAPTPQPMYAQSMGLAKDSASIAPSVQTGQQEVDSTITLTYQVK